MLNKINGLIKNIQLAKKQILAMNIYTINFINGEGNCKIHFMDNSIQ